MHSNTCTGTVNQIRFISTQDQPLLQKESQFLAGMQIFIWYILNEELDAPLSLAKFFNDLFYLLS